MITSRKLIAALLAKNNKPWEWVPEVSLGGKTLAGTGVWRSTLLDGRCSSCETMRREGEKANQRAQDLRESAIELFGGIKPYREFTFERFRVTPGNQVAFTRAKAFQPKSENFFFRGACGAGKTHLAYALSRNGLEHGFSVSITTQAQLVRRSRMKEPDQEQAVIDHWAHVDVLVLEELGKTNDTPFSRQILQEVLDRRAFRDRGGLVVTSQYSLDQLAQRSGDDAIPSRLAGMCQLIRITGGDYRLQRAEVSR